MKERHKRAIALAHAQTNEYDQLRILVEALLKEVKQAHKIKSNDDFTCPLLKELDKIINV